MKRLILLTTLCLCAIGFASPSYAQVSPVRLKVSKKQKSNYKTTYRSTDGKYRNREGIKSVSYTVDIMNVSGGPPRDLKIQWAILVESNSYTYTSENGQSRRLSPLRAVQGEQTCTLDFGKTFTFVTDVVELEGTETSSYGSQSKYGAKVLGYSVEVYISDQLVASDYQPSSIKAKIEQVSGDSDQKRHRF